MKQVGILLPLFALPNQYGIGSLGKQAFRFIDFLSDAKQDYWQILPTNPTTYGDSPYQSFSSHAQNPYFIDLSLLVEEHLLTRRELKEAKLENSSWINYGDIFYKKMSLLKKTYIRRTPYQKAFAYFKAKQRHWLLDYALFMVLKEKNQYKTWNTWSDEFKYRDPQALKKFYLDNKDEVETYMFLQFLYFRQWKSLIRYAHKKKIQIIGDMPIYVAYDSVDVWANPQYFLLDEKYCPTKVAGVPPDYFSEKGQLWGNPLYNYEVMKKDQYAWWTSRILHSLNLFDYLRIDHFRGFSAFYAIPYGHEDATKGKWIKGPGLDLFEALKAKTKKVNIIAENLGLLDDDVYQLLKQTKYPGMRILQFEMYSKENIEVLKKSQPHTILYPGTHDNNTFLGWFNKEASSVEKENVRNELKVSKLKTLTRKLIQYCYQFPFDYTIIAMQDILGLDDFARMNCPGTSTHNWQFRFSKQDFSKEIAKRLARYKEKYIINAK